MARAALPRRRAHRYPQRCATASRNFIEVNPLAGLRPEHSDLCFIARFKGVSYQELIGKIMDSFLKRHPELRGTVMMRVLVLHSDVPPDAPPDEQDTLITARAIGDALHRAWP